MEPFAFSHFEIFVLFCAVLIITLGALNYGFTQGETHARHSEAQKIARLKTDCAEARQALYALRESLAAKTPTPEEQQARDLSELQRLSDEITVLLMRRPTWQEYTYTRLKSSLSKAA